MPKFKNLVSVDWLAERLDNDMMKVFDATFYLPIHGKNAAQEFASAAIPGAQFFDLDSICDTTIDLPHMLPSAEDFKAAMQNFGVRNSDTIVIYDQHGLFSAARLWWMFKVFGHRNVYVLDGGLPAWTSAGHAVAPGRNNAEKSDYEVVADHRDELAISREQLMADQGLWQHVLDARPNGRFTGEVPEPRAGMRSGHIPGSQNMPFTDLVDSNGFLQAPEVLAQKLSVASSTPITSCGSGVTAAIITLALDEIGKPIGRLYDGSWADWGLEDTGTPIDTSA